ncbi:MAG: hypothetical protein SQA66_15210 [Candidatus Fervidibacter sacchari]
MKRRHGEAVTKNKNANRFYASRLYALRITPFSRPRPSPLVPFRYVVIFVTVKSKMAKMAGK